MQQHALIKEYLDIAFRRKWWIVLPAILGVLFALAFFVRAPKLYKAQTRVQIRGQTISRALLTPIIEMNAVDMVTQITGEITSEKYVQDLEDRLGLIGTPDGPQDVAELAKRLDTAIDVAPNPRNRYFDLAVTWRDPGIAAAIANELAAIYMRRSQEVRRSMATETLGQLRAKREELEAALTQVRGEIERFRGEHKFELASQQQTNLQAIEGARAEIDRIENEIRAARAQIENIDIQLQQPVVVAPGQPQRDDTRERLLALRREREGLLQRGRTEQHPDVKKLDADIAVLERQVTPVPGTGGDAGPDLARAQLEASKKRLQGDIAAGQTRQARLQAEIGEIQARLDRTPQWQIELDTLVQREDGLEEQYVEARNKEAAALEGTQAEESSQGERFEVLNKAIRPSEPFWPDLRLFLLMGLAVGGGFGIAVVLLLEVFDQSFKTEEQLAASIDLPLLAVIPDLSRLPDETRRRLAGKPR